MTNFRKRGPKCAKCGRALPTKAQKAAAVLRQQQHRLRSANQQVKGDNP